MDIDSNELEGRWFRCLEGCALCCLCQPELVAGENKMFSSSGHLSAGITRRSITGQKGRNYSIRLKDDKGSCYFLKERLCTIYDKRPFYCRLFPIHIHVGDRVQVVANLSCPGINDNGGGVPLTGVGRQALDEAKRLKQMKGLGKVGDLYRAFYADYLQGMKDLERGPLQDLTADLLRGFGFTDFVKRTMAYSSIPGDAPGDVGSIATFLEDLGSPDVNDAAVRGAVDTFGSDDIVSLPVWVDQDLNWMICRLQEGQVEMCQMGDDGGLKILQKTPLEEVGLRPLGPGAEDLALRYCELVIERDLTYGYAAYMKTLTEDDEPFLQVYLGSLGTILLDFWWRASMLSAFSSEGTISVDRLRAGILAYDMDFLDLPSLGGFI